jgi:hypothetical protein
VDKIIIAKQTLYSIFTNAGGGGLPQMEISHLLPMLCNPISGQSNPAWHDTCMYAIDHSYGF